MCLFPSRLQLHGHHGGGINDVTAEPQHVCHRSCGAHVCICLQRPIRIWLVYHFLTGFFQKLFLIVIFIACNFLAPMCLHWCGRWDAASALFLLISWCSIWHQIAFALNPPQTTSYHKCRRREFPLLFLGSGTNTPTLQSQRNTFQQRNVASFCLPHFFPFPCRWTNAWKYIADDLTSNIIQINGKCSASI